MEEDIPHGKYTITVDIASETEVSFVFLLLWFWGGVCFERKT